MLIVRTLGCKLVLCFALFPLSTPFSLLQADEGEQGVGQIDCGIDHFEFARDLISEKAGPGEIRQILTEAEYCAEQSKSNKADADLASVNLHQAVLELLYGDWDKYGVLLRDARDLAYDAPAIDTSAARIQRVLSTWLIPLTVTAPDGGGKIRVKLKPLSELPSTTEFDQALPTPWVKVSEGGVNPWQRALDYANQLIEQHPKNSITVYVPAGTYKVNQSVYELRPGGDGVTHQMMLSAQKRHHGAAYLGFLGTIPLDSTTLASPTTGGAALKLDYDYRLGSTANYLSVATGGLLHTPNALATKVSLNYNLSEVSYTVAPDDVSSSSPYESGQGIYTCADYEAMYVYSISNTDTADWTHSDLPSSDTAPVFEDLDNVTLPAPTAAQSAALSKSCGYGQNTFFIDAGISRRVITYKSLDLNIGTYLRIYYMNGFSSATLSPESGNPLELVDFTKAITFSPMADLELQYLIRDQSIRWGLVTNFTVGAGPTYRIRVSDVDEGIHGLGRWVLTYGLNILLFAEKGDNL